MKQTLVDLIDLLRLAADRWNADKAPRLAAALAYYATFSLAPLALVTIWIAGLIFGDTLAQNYLVQQIGKTFGADSAAFVQSMIGAVERNSSSTLFSAIALHRARCGAASRASSKIAPCRF